MLSQRALIRFATPSPSSSLQQQRPSSSPRVLTFSCRNGNGNSSVAAATLKIPYRSSLGTEHVEYDRGSEFETPKQQDDKTEYNKEPEDEEEEEEDDDDETVGKVRVPRQKYIAVSKTELLEAIVTNLMADSTSDQVLQFRRLSSCLDSIFHAEHKQILEEMRNDYFQACYMDSEETTSEGSDRLDKNVAAKSCLDADFVNGVGSMVEDVREETELERHIPFNYSLDFKKNFSSPPQNVRSFSDEETRRASATRFQRSFMQLLSNAQFEELSARDLSLASSLNTDYLLTLPIYVDWKRAAEANAIIFRRGYATERQKGLLIVEKLDYLQSRLLQKIIFTLSKPLGKVCTWALNNATQKEEGQGLMKKVKLWLQQPYSVNGKSSNNFLRVDELAYRDLPIWLAAQRAVSRYEGFLSVTGPRGRLLRKFLIWTGLLSPAEEIQYELESDSNASESLSRPILLSRISLSDIWQPASRKSCGNDFWKRFKTSASILLSKSILQEPAFEELILLYTEDVGKSDNEVELPPLQLKVYERIPIPDLPVIFPHKKLSFRIIDSVRLDIATILGLLAYIINYKFEDIFFSPSAIVLDVIAISALVIFLTRVALGYKQTWDRYQLLVNKTLYEKTLASGFGSVHFLLDASEQQQYKEAILAYAILLKEENGQVTCHQSVQEKCERFMFCVLKEKIEMPIDKAISTLSRLGLVTETTIGGKTIFQVVPSSAACEVLQRRWNNLFV